MVNFGLNPASLLGIFLVVAGAGLYFLRSIRPELSREHDIFFSFIGLVCGGILVFQGWRLDPILQLSQFLLAATAIFFATESVRLRGIATEQAKRSTPIVDDERPVSPRYRPYQAYQAELEQLEPEDEPPPRARIRGTQGTRRPRPESYEDETRRRPNRSNDRPSSDRPIAEKPTAGDRQRPRRPRPEEPPANQSDWGGSAEEGERPVRTSGTKSPTRNPDGSTKPKRSRPPGEPGASRRREGDAIPTDYVDYRPVEPEEGDNGGNFDRD